MSSSWPIVIAIFGLVAAAFWYDASVASANARTQQPDAPDTPVQAANTR
jgi:hypothetical protein